MHLREIARKTKLNESTVFSHLKLLADQNIVRFEKEGNLKKFSLRKQAIPSFFPYYDEEQLEKLPLLRKNAIRYYISKAGKKPIFIVLFGSTAKGSFRDDSDIDLIEVYNEKTDNHEAAEYAESQTGLRISTFQLTFRQFVRELKLKEEPVIQSGISTGFPVFNSRFYYEVLNNERV